MHKKTAVENAIELHHKMYEQRCRNVAWYHGQSRREILERINTLPVRDRQSTSKQNNGRRPK